MEAWTHRTRSDWWAPHCRWAAAGTVRCHTLGRQFPRNLRRNRTKAMQHLGCEQKGEGMPHRYRWCATAECQGVRNRHRCRRGTSRSWKVPWRREDCRQRRQPRPSSGHWPRPTSRPRTRHASQCHCHRLQRKITRWHRRANPTG